MFTYPSLKWPTAVLDSDAIDQSIAEALGNETTSISVRVDITPGSAKPMRTLITVRQAGSVERDYVRFLDGGESGATEIELAALHGGDSLTFDVLVLDENGFYAGDIYENIA